MRLIACGTLDILQHCLTLASKGVRVSFCLRVPAPLLLPTPGEMQQVHTLMHTPSASALATTPPLFPRLWSPDADLKWGISAAYAECLQHDMSIAMTYCNRLS